VASKLPGQIFEIVPTTFPGLWTGEMGKRILWRKLGEYDYKHFALSSPLPCPQTTNAFSINEIIKKKGMRKSRRKRKEKRRETFLRHLSHFFRGKIPRRLLHGGAYETMTELVKDAEYKAGRRIFFYCGPNSPDGQPNGAFERLFNRGGSVASFGILPHRATKESIRRSQRREEIRATADGPDPPRRARLQAPLGSYRRRARWVLSGARARSPKLTEKPAARRPIDRGPRRSGPRAASRNLISASAPVREERLPPFRNGAFR